MLKKLLIIVITGTRPLLGPAYCKYPVSCTQYAVQQLQKNQSLFAACFAIIKRLIGCNPFMRVFEE